MSNRAKFLAALAVGVVLIGIAIAVVVGNNSANEQKATASYTQCMDVFQQKADDERLAGDSLSQYLAKGAEYCQQHEND